MKTLLDTWLVFGRELRTTLRNPVWVIVALFQPFCYLFLFAPFLEDISKAPGFPEGGVFTVFTPGILIMLGFLGTAFAGMSTVDELRNGLLERLRVTPVSRLALLLGRVTRDVVVLLVQGILVVLASLPLGIQLYLPGLALALLLVIVLGIGMASCSYVLALVFKDEGTMASLVNMLLLPLMMLSGIMLPISFAPNLLQQIARFNPLVYVVDAARALFIGDLGHPAIWQGFAIALVLAIITLFWARRQFSSAMA